MRAHSLIPLYTRFPGILPEPVITQLRGMASTPGLLLADRPHAALRTHI